MNNEEQKPVDASLEAIARKQFEIDQKLDRILAIIEPKPNTSESPKITEKSMKGAAAGESKWTGITKGGWKR